MIPMDYETIGGRTMETPLCDNCLTGDPLCQACSEKLEKGEITELDKTLSRTLYSIDKEYNLGDITFKKSIEANNLIVMIVGKEDVGRVVGKRGKIVRILRRKVNKKIRVVGDTDDLKVFVAELIYPAKLVGIDRIFPVSEEPINRVRIEKSSRDKIPALTEEIETALSKIKKENTKIVFE